MGEQAAVRRLAADPGFLLSRVGAAVRAGFHEVLAARRVRPQQYMILLILDTSDGVSQQELCAAVGVDSGNMVELLDGLEALDCARRDRDLRDRRRHLVTITARGREVLAELSHAVDEYNDSFLSMLAESERLELARILGKLFAATPEGRRQGASTASPSAESL
jgi:DNA-binding MarR family transcriptional regulator